MAVEDSDMTHSEHAGEAYCHLNIYAESQSLLQNKAIAVFSFFPRSRGLCVITKTGNKLRRQKYIMNRGSLSLLMKKYILCFRC